ncbi:unnamed protein product [Discula destructiva]
MVRLLCLWAISALFTGVTTAVSIAEINGNKFLSPYSGQNVVNVTGVVTAKSGTGIFIRSLIPDNDPATSESVFVFSSTVGSSLSVGDQIALDGKVSEYRSNTAYLFLTELTSPKNVRVLSSDNAVAPLVIGEDTSNPPTEQYSSLDGGDVYALPGGAANISALSPVLDPESYGMDFWESLCGELVTIRNVTIVSPPNSYDETWVTGGWPVTGRSLRGSLTMSSLDSNPETIKVGDPLDGTSNPSTLKIGDKAADITGVIYQQYGFYYILPQTALEVTTVAEGLAPPTTLMSSRSCESITIGDYNVENLTPAATKFPALADHIVNYLGAPDLLFVQEIQDNSGATDDGVVDASQTLTALVNAVSALSNITYDYAAINPVDGEDGGEPGGNIRVAYLYRPKAISLYNPNPGNSTAANEVLSGESGPELLYNPGRIDPSNAAWAATRKPLVAAWMAAGATKPFFTVNVHWSSKGGGTSLQGDVRPPLNGAVSKRVQQAQVTGEFISEILALDPSAAVIAAGDFNEFTFVEPLVEFASVSGLSDLDEVVGTPVAERYTYTFDMNTQALDHIFTSPVLAAEAEYEHVHVNVWAASGDALSDHDPSVARLNLCGAAN